MVLSLVGKIRTSAKPVVQFLGTFSHPWIRATGAPDLEAVEPVASVPLVDVDAFGGHPDPGFGTFDCCLQRVAVIGVAMQGVDVDDKLAAGRYAPGAGLSYALPG